ncbi:MAG: amidohydrolase [Parasporobacterium sp.]|nr:amidohydrolase [Parasporobacterium sp.]
MDNQGNIIAEKKESEKIHEDMTDRNAAKYPRHDLKNTASEGHNKTIAIRGDIDALPITEETGVSYASVNPGVMHACGHDCHAAYMLGAAKILYELRSSFSGTVKVIFQEGEETGIGAEHLMRSHLLDSVDRIVGLHVTQEYDLGTFAFGYGVRTAFGAAVRVTIDTAVPGNTGIPAANALLAAAGTADAIEKAAKEIFPQDEKNVLVPTVVRTVRTAVSAAGQGPEARRIPSLVYMEYNFRSHNLNGFKMLHSVFGKIQQDIASAFNAVVTVEPLGYDEAVINDDAAVELAKEVIARRFGEKAILLTPPRMSGEDFAMYNKKIPGVFLHVGGAVNGNYCPLHTSKTLADDGVLSQGLLFLLDYVFAYLNA